MKKILLTLLLCGGVSHAQIAIGTELPDPSAQLHVVSKNGDQGILIPEIALKGIEDKTVIKGNNPKEGLVIFNTVENDALKLTKGFYYWGKISLDTNGLPVMGWNKLIGNDDLQKYVTENRSIVTYDKIDSDSTNKTTAGFKLAVNGTDIGTFNEALTKFSLETAKYYVLVKDGSPTADPNAPEELYIKLESGDTEEDFPDSKAVAGYDFSDVVISKEEFIYTDETGKTDIYELNNVLESAETLTSLRLENNYPTTRNGVEVRVPALIYKDESAVENPIFLDRLFEFSESLTSLTLDTTKMVLIYKDEKNVENEVDVNAIVKSAWHKVNATGEAANYGDSIHTDGWVGIGYDKPSDAPNEKLRVNGSVTAVNSYYADYVFDAYFNGTSALKYDYTFKNLSTIEDFIKENNHLPGITPIQKLTKSNVGYSFNLSELSIQLLEKTEELYLHTIDQEKEINLLKEENFLLKNRLDQIELLLQEKLAK